MIFRQQDNKINQGDVKVSSRKDKWKKTLTFLLFLFLALGFWLLQTLQQPFEIRIPVLVNYKNVPHEIVLDSGIPRKIFIKVSDKGTSLLQYTFGQKKNEEIEIDLQNIDLKKSRYVVTRENLEQLIRKSLLSTTSLLEFHPDLLTVSYSGLQKKELPVKLIGQLSPSSGYMLIDTPVFAPRKVYAYGSQDELKSLNEIYTDTVDVKDIRGEWKKQVRLQLPDGVELSHNAVELKVTSREFTEKTIEVPVICKNIPENYMARFFPQTVTLTVYLLLSDYEKVDPLLFEVTADYQEMLQSKDYKVLVSLSRRPDWVRNYKISPEKIEFLIEQKK